MPSCPATAGTTSRRPAAARSASAGSRWPRWSGWPTTWPPPTPDATLRDFVAELDERADAQHAPTVEGVTLASLHAAKGLEWDAVFVVGVTDGMMPITYADTPEAVEEERRLLYVGVTRARAVADDHLGDRPRARRPRVAGGPPGSSTACTRAAVRRSRRLPGKGPRKRGPAACRVCGKSLDGAAARKLGRCESCPSSYDEALFERLREWRAEQAKEASVPAYVVFTDLTLIALAEARPTSDAELLAISGIGRTKLERYGADVLAICAGVDGADRHRRRRHRQRLGHEVRQQSKKGLHLTADRLYPPVKQRPDRVPCQGPRKPRRR